MASKFKRAGAGNWSADASWSTTSGGAADTVKPTAADDVFIDANSGNPTIDAASACRSINCTGFTGTLTHNSFTLSVGDGTAGASNIALKFVSGMTYTRTSATASAIDFISTSSTQQDVDFAGKTSGNVTFNASSNGSWKYTGAHTSALFGGFVTLTKGSLDTNGQACSWNVFSSSNTNVRSLTLGSSNITITGGSTTCWDFTTATNLTFNAGTSTITFTGTGFAILNGTGKTFYDVVFTGGGNAYIRGGNTYHSLSITGLDTELTLPSGATNTTGTITLSGTAGHLNTLDSSTPGSQATLSVASGTVSADYITIKDSNAIGGAAFVPGDNAVDGGNNSGWRFSDKSNTMLLMGI